MSEMKDSFHMKKRLVSAIVLIYLIGCSGNSAVSTASSIVSETTAGSQDISSAEQVSEESNTEYFDNEFLAKFGEALQARWKKDNETDESQVTDEEYLSFLLELVNTERNILGEYYTQKFEDPILQEYAISYLNGLAKQADTIEKHDTVDESFQTEWDKAFLKRAEAIIYIYDNYEISIDSKYLFQLNSMRNGIGIERMGRKMMWNMLNAFGNLDVEVNMVGDVEEYRISVINDSIYEFRDLTILLVVYKNETDEEIDRAEYVVGDWKPGEKKEMVFLRNNNELSGNEVQIGLYPVN